MDSLTSVKPLKNLILVFIFVINFKILQWSIKIVFLESNICENTCDI